MYKNQLLQIPIEKRINLQKEELHVEQQFQQMVKGQLEVEGMEKEEQVED
jgi:hypothetical protein